MSESIRINCSDLYFCDELKKVFEGKVISSDDYDVEVPKSAVLEMTELNLKNCRYSRIKGIENFINLTSLSISNNSVQDISFLSKLTKLKKLDLLGTTINDLSAIENLTNLEYLDISRTQLSDSGKNVSNCVMSIVSKFTKLTYLNASRSYIVYLNGIEKLQNLTYLDLYDNGIKDISKLSSLTNLVTLKLGMNNEQWLADPMTGLSALNKLTKLTYLDFSDNGSPDLFKYINNLVNLEKLRAEANMIEDISGVENLTKLKSLVLYFNKIGDLSPLVNLKQLEELILMKNSMWDVSILFDKNKNEMIFPNLKKFSLAEQCYNAPQNTDMINYLRTKMKEDLEFDFVYKMYDTTNLPHKDKNNIEYVTFEDFGAKKNGTYDDLISIKYTHIFANEHNYEVRATPGSTYHIFKYYDDPIVVKTNVDWKGATFIIHDENIEEYKGCNKRLFDFTNIIEEDVVTLEKEKDNINWTINKKTKKISEIVDTFKKLKEKGYQKFMCKAYNSNKKIFIRYGMNANDGADLQDSFIVDLEGNVLNDIQWDFEEITSFVITPIPNNTMYVKNGKFIHKVFKPYSETPYSRPGKGIYYYRNLNFDRIYNCKISNIDHEIEKDVMSGSYQGFISILNGANIELTDTKLFARPFKRNTGRSTYDLSIESLVGLKVSNLYSTDLQNELKWGLMGSNFCKDISFNNVTMNRIDSHEGLYNINVTNSNIGVFGFTMTGQNIMNIVNTTIEAPQIISLREDYGSVWNGNLNIINCKFIPSDSPRIIDYGFSFDNGKLHDFGYDLKFPKVYISNLSIDHIKGQLNRNPVIINNDKNNNAKKITDITKSYLSNADIIIDGIYFINQKFDNNQSIISTDLIENFNKNVFISDLKFISDNIDRTSEMYLKNNLTFNKDVKFSINKNKYSNNNVRIYNKDKLINDFFVKDSSHNVDFKENGNYKIEVDSIDNEFGYKGKLEYDFFINKKESDEKSLPDKESNSILLIISGGLIIILLLGIFGFFWHRRNKKNKNIEVEQLDKLVDKL